MAIFNSLGSNYDFGFIFQALFAADNYKKELEKLLQEKYKGDVVLLYKGREALRLALRASNLKGAHVAICGFTCFAVYDAIVKEGYEVEYIDIDKNSLHFSAEDFKKRIEKNSEIKIVIIQNTLGYSCDIEGISKVCKENNIILIEDLAHSIGTIYENGKEAGTLGDFTVLSFSQDKVVDGISGGALIIRNEKFMNEDLKKMYKNVSIKKQIIDKLYPLFTYKIRKEYGIGLGKLYHAILKKLHFLSNPMSESDALRGLPNWYCYLIYIEFKNLEANIQHRRKIAQVYYKRLTKNFFLYEFENKISISTNLRFPIFVENREKLIEYLKKNNIFVSDIWYDSPIAPKKYLQLTNYKNECPQAEKIADLILNLPTHKNVSEKDARYISDTINQWEVLQ